MNWDELRAAWRLPAPAVARQINHGINNLTQLLETTTGNYILRAYPSDRPLKYIRNELHTLTRLQQKSLPFQIPAPIPTLTGELYTVSSEVVFTLSPWLSGSPPQSENLKQAHAAGQALAQLDRTLADLEVDATEEIAPFPPSGDFEAWAGTRIDPSELIPRLPLSQEEQRQILVLLEIMQAKTDLLYQSLPQQIIHRDYDQSNLLMEGNRVTGVLDFEFCGTDLRILDLAYALTQWSAGLWNSGEEWAVIDSFLQGYLQHQPLTSAELEALPWIFRLRNATSLFFRFGRYGRGLETLDRMREHLQEALRSASWLQMHEKELMRHIRRLGDAENGVGK